MNNLTTVADRLPAMSSDAVARVRRLGEYSKQFPQVPIETHHTIHGGLYTRTIMVPAGVVLTGVQIKIPTTLIVNGHATVHIGDRAVEVNGYHVFAGSAFRQQAFFAHTDTWLTMCFPTNATTVEEAEHEFTDEYDLLMSHDNNNTLLITGE